jgi:hypothetical protein
VSFWELVFIYGRFYAVRLTVLNGFFLWGWKIRLPESLTVHINISAARIA